MGKIGKGASGGLDWDDPTDRLPAPLNNKFFTPIVYAIEKSRKGTSGLRCRNMRFHINQIIRFSLELKELSRILPFWSKYATPQNSSN